MDIDEIFGSTTDCWRDRVTGDALADIEKIEARIEETRDRPSWTKIAEGLAEYGFSVTAVSVGNYYRKRYPFLRRER